jgi:N-methylhydantoinase A/acetone carboxylase beta subunit
VLGKGYSPVDYALFCYGGGGPLHVCGYTRGVSYRDVLVPAWAAGFSAFGCACADLEYRYDLTVDIPILGTPESKRQVATIVQGAWDTLHGRVLEEFAKSSVPPSAIRWSHLVRMQYNGQLNDIEVRSPVEQLERPEDIDRLVDVFEDAYGKMYARSAKSPELGYLVTTAIVLGAVEVEKPTLPVEPETDSAPEPKAAREVFWDTEFVSTPIHEQGEVRAGQTISGPAIVESPADTLAIPPGRAAILDQHRIFHIQNAA